MDTNNNTMLLAQPLTLPCGAVMKNRIIKSCMSDSLGDGTGNPTAAQIRLYERWAEGGVAMSCIGEVQIDYRYPEKPGNLVIVDNCTGSTSNSNSTSTSNSIKNDDVDEERTKKWSRFRELARRGTMNGAHLWPQLGHAGALAHLPVNATPKGPSALHVEGLDCEAMTRKEMQALPSAYAQGAQKAKECGFTGVLLHAGHGFLLSQWLSPLFNKREDDYGGNIQGRCRLVLEILSAMRTAVGPSFPIGIRINSSDQLEGGLTEDDALEVIRMLDKTSVDLIDISGGTYFPGAKAASDGTSGGGAYFLDFCHKARPLTTKPILLTGGFKKRSQAIEALSSGAVDMVGVARALALNANLAHDWTTMAETDHADNVSDPSFPRFEKTVPGGITAWFTMRLTALGEDREGKFDMDLPTAVRDYDARDAVKTELWKTYYKMP